LISLVEEKARGEELLRIVIFLTISPEIYQGFLEETKSRLSPEKVFLAELSPVIGTHVGPGTPANTSMHGM
jgi:fatty acid-binding protein DegV